MNSALPERHPFNLQHALAGDPVVRRDGVSVLEVLRFKSGNVLKPVISLSENGETHRHYEDGSMSRECATHDDLFMAPDTKTVYRLAFRNLQGDIELAVVKFSDRRSAEELAERLPLPGIQVVAFTVTA